MFFVLVSSANAMIDSTGLLEYFTLDDSNIKGYLGNANLTNNGATLAVPAKLINGTKFWDFPQWLNTTGIVSKYNSHSISVWINASKLNETEPIISERSTSDDDPIFSIFIENSAGYKVGFRIRSNAGTGIKTIYSATISENVWYHVVVTYNLTNGAMILYVNNVTTTDTYSGGTFDSINAFRIGRDGAVPSYPNPIGQMHGIIDDVIVFNRTLGASEVAELYNNGNGLSNPFTSAIPQSNLTFISQSPANYTQYASNILAYNITFTNQPINATGLSVTCNLTDNSAIRGGQTGDVNGTATFNVSYTATGGTHTYNFTCTNGFNSFTSNPYIFYVDTAIPTMTTNYTNNSVHYNDSDNYYFRFLDDQSLYLVNFTIGSIFAYQNSSLGGTTSYNMTWSWQMSNYPVAKQNITIYYCDGHTAQTMESLDVSKSLLTDKISFADKETTISIAEKQDSILNIFEDKWDTEKQTDRYTFTYSPVKPTDTYTFIVETDDDLTIIDKPDTRYKKWIVAGKHWVDFVPKNEPDFKIEIKQIDRRKAEVTISNLKNIEKIEFESIGALNCVTQVFWFYNLNTSSMQNLEEVEGAYSSYNFTIQKDNTEVSTLANFTYNNLIYTPTKTNYSTYDFYNVTIPLSLIGSATVNSNASWNWTATAGDTITKGNSFTQTVEQMIISNCSAPNNPAAGYSNSTFYQILDDSSFANAGNGTMTNSYIVWASNGNSSLTRSYGISWAYNNPAAFSLCLWPNASINYSVSGTYSAMGYSPNTYVVVNDKMNKTVQTINLLLTYGATTQTVTLVDQYNTKLYGYLMDLYHKNTNLSYSLLSSKYSDINGNTIWSIATTQTYKFIIKNSTGQQVYDTGDLYFVSNPTTITLGGATTFANETMNAYLVAVSLVNDNATKNVIMSWATLSGNGRPMCLHVQKMNYSGAINISDTCNAASSGNITVSYAAYGNGTYTATAYVQGSVNIIKSIDWVINQATALWNYLGNDGIVLHMILVLLGSLMFIVDVSLIPYGMLAGHLIGWWMGLIPMSYGMIIALILGVVIVIVRMER